MKQERPLLDYQAQDCALTLREGMAQYFDANPELIDPDDPGECSPRAAELFRRHDVVHVVFGTNTSVIQEAMTDMWAMCGTSVGFKKYMSYLREPEASDILKQIGWMRAFVLSMKAIPAMFEVWRRSRKLHHKWDWDGFDAYWDVPLVDIRRELGVHVFQPNQSVTSYEQSHAA